ncbi:MAG: response regulator transcription factor [Tepidiformaceae bacterium]
MTEHPQIPGPALKPRWLLLLDPISRGVPNKQIARELGLSNATVKRYVSDLLVAFGASNRTELALRIREIQGPK